MSASKWEYLVLVSQLSGDRVRPRFVNGKQLENWDEGPGLPEYLNQLGDEGWELASAATGSVLYFKRPKS